MKVLVSVFIFISSMAHAEVTTVLTLQRVNYKPEKRLVYDVNYNATTCEINLTTPFDIYYRDNETGEKLSDFSSDSEKFFGAKMNTKIWTPTSVSLEFKAFDEVKNATGADAMILVNMINENGTCSAEAQYMNEPETYVLKHIDISMKKIFGLPTGVSWVQMYGESETGPVLQCVVGTCS